MAGVNSKMLVRQRLPQPDTCNPEKVGFIIFFNYYDLKKYFLLFYCTINIAFLKKSKFFLFLIYLRFLVVHLMGVILNPTA